MGSKRATICRDCGQSFTLHTIKNFPGKVGLRWICPPIKRDTK